MTRQTIANFLGQSHFWCNSLYLLGTESTTSFSTECANPDWVKDGFCDDEINNLDCYFDGGDCCGDGINTAYCTLCQCKDENSNFTTLSSIGDFFKSD